MATTKVQRVGIWIIAAFMAIGTVGSFAIIVLANDNAQKDQAKVNELTAEYQAATDAYNKKVAERSAKYTDNAAELSSKHFETFNAHSSRVGTFDADAVNELKKKDLVVGSGEAITSDDVFVAYYLGWNPSGKIFDGSIDGSSLSAPFVAEPGGVIQGWTQGVDGMKVGGIRELTIPAELAYGEAGSGEDIPANTPLKFLVYVIAKEDVIEQPEMSEALMNYYTTGGL